MPQAICTAFFHDRQVVFGDIDLGKQRKCRVIVDLTEIHSLINNIEFLILELTAWETEID